MHLCMSQEPIWVFWDAFSLGQSRISVNDY
jgi:hypothetical protein